MSKKKTKKNVDKKSIIRIIAVALVIVVIAVITIVQVTKDNPRKFTDADGNEHLLYVDEEGNTVLNKSGGIIVYATDAAGDIVKDEDGEPVTNAIAFPEVVIEGNVLETPYYKMTMPDSWTLKENGVYEYNENKDVTFEIVSLGAYNSDAEAYAQDEMERLQELAKQFEKEYPASSLTKTAGTITMKNIICRSIETVIGKTEGDVFRYGYDIYFVYNETAYVAMFNCANNSYEQIKDVIDIHEIVNQNLAMKDKTTSENK